MSGAKGVSFNVPARYLAAGMASLQVSLMLFTYTACILQDECPHLPRLPTISNTWDNPPGNYASRFVVSIVSLIICLVQYIIWQPEIGRICCAQALMVSGTIAGFLLSVVGAVCDDDTDPQCRGDNLLHSCCAITFFVLYNVNMIILTAKGSGLSASSRGRLAVAAALSVAGKLRWLPATGLFSTDAVLPNRLGDLTPVAIVEWADVFLICGWTVHFVWSSRFSYEVCLYADGAGVPARPRLASIPVRIICGVVLTLFFGTLSSTLAFYVAEGRLVAGTVPYISDLWVYKPGDWISRWAVMLGGSLTIFCHCCLAVMDAAARGDLKPSASDGYHLAMAVVAVLGLMVVGCVNEDENPAIHFTAAGIFFGGYDAFMLKRTASLALSPPRCDEEPAESMELASPSKYTKAVATSAQAAPSPPLQQLRRLAPLVLLTLVSCACTILRYTAIGQHKLASLSVAAGWGSDPFETTVPVAEWLDALSIVSYMSTSVFQQKALSRATGFGYARPE